MAGGRVAGGQVKPVAALDVVSGVEVARYRSAVEAARAVGGCGPGISQAVHGIKRTYKGLKWRLIDR